jgi:hypothetical protein
MTARHPAEEPCTLALGDGGHAARLVNISRGGALLTCAARPAEGSMATLVLDRQGGASAQARVLVSEGGSGMVRLAFATQSFTPAFEAALRKLAPVETKAAA